MMIARKYVEEFEAEHNRKTRRTISNTGIVIPAGKAGKKEPGKPGSGCITQLLETLNRHNKTVDAMRAYILLA